MNLDEMTEEEIEEEASRQGWKNDPDHPNFKTAREFVETGQQIAAVANKELQSVKQELARVIEASDKLTAMQSEAQERARKEGYEQAKSELHQKQLKAVDDGDQEEYQKLREKEQELDEEFRKPEPAVTEDSVKQVFDRHMRQNADLFETPEGQEAVRKQWAFHETKYRAKGEAPDPDKFCQEVYDAARKDTTQGSVIPGLDDGGNSSPSNKGSSKSRNYQNLPPEAKKECDRFIEMKLLGMKSHGDKKKAREQYCQTYPWS